MAFEWVGGWGACHREALTFLECIHARRGLHNYFGFWIGHLFFVLHLHMCLTDVACFFVMLLVLILLTCLMLPKYIVFLSCNHSKYRCGNGAGPMARFRSCTWQSHRMSRKTHTQTRPHEKCNRHGIFQRWTHNPSRILRLLFYSREIHHVQDRDFTTVKTW